MGPLDLFNAQKFCYRHLSKRAILPVTSGSNTQRSYSILVGAGYPQPSCLHKGSLNYPSGRRASHNLFSLPPSFNTCRRLFSRSHFTYCVAAAYSAKDANADGGVNVSTFSHDCKSAAKSTIEEGLRDADRVRRSSSGQDAFFVSPVGTSGDMAFGVVCSINPALLYRSR